MYNVFYDGEFCEYYKTLEEAIDHIRGNYKGYTEDKEKYPEYYSEKEEFPFDLYEILKNVAPENLEDLVKNKT